MKTYWQRLSEGAVFIWIILLYWGWTLVGSLSAVFSAALDHIADSDLWYMLAIELTVMALAGTLLHWRHWRFQESFIIRQDWPALAWALAILLMFWSGGYLANIISETLGITEKTSPVTVAAPISTLAVVLFSIVNGLFEELFLIGFIHRAWCRHGITACIIISCTLRAITHFYQGFDGTITMIFYGLFNWTVYLRTRNLWPLILAHIMADAIGLLAIAMTVNS